jgi:hypothetical protein
MRKTTIIAFTLAILPCATRLAQRPERTPLLKTPHFVFYDDPEMNLNDALIAAGLARKNAKPELFQADAEAACFQRLAPSARAGCWVARCLGALGPACLGTSVPRFLGAPMGRGSDPRHRGTGEAEAPRNGRLSHRALAAGSLRSGAEAYTT